MKTLFTGKTKSQKELTIRYPTSSDLKAMWHYINELSQERTFIRFQGETISLEEEEKYLARILEQCSKKRMVTLLALAQEKLIGISDIEMRHCTEKHTGTFSLSISKDFRGDGIGHILLEKTVEEAKKTIPHLEIVTLKVFSTNTPAINLYKKFGFKEYGRLPNGAKFESKYADDILMYLQV